MPGKHVFNALMSKQVVLGCRSDGLLTLEASIYVGLVPAYNIAHRYVTDSQFASGKNTDAVADLVGPSVAVPALSATPSCSWLKLMVASTVGRPSVSVADAMLTSDSFTSTLKLVSVPLVAKMSLPAVSLAEFVTVS